MGISFTFFMNTGTPTTSPGRKSPQSINLHSSVASSSQKVPTPIDIILPTLRIFQVVVSRTPMMIMLTTKAPIRICSFLVIFVCSPPNHASSVSTMRSLFLTMPLTSTSRIATWKILPHLGHFQIRVTFERIDLIDFETPSSVRHLTLAEPAHSK